MPIRSGGGHFLVARPARRASMSMASSPTVMSEDYEKRHSRAAARVRREKPAEPARLGDVVVGARVEADDIARGA